MTSCALLLQTVPAATHFLCLNPLRVHQVAYCPFNMRPLRTPEGACPHLTSLQLVS